MNISMHHLIPWLQLDYHTDSNNSEPKIWLQHCWKLIQNFKMVWFFILLFREIKIYRSWHQLYPSITSWCARDTNVNPLLWLKVSEISWKNGFIFWKKSSQKNLHIPIYVYTWPKVYPAPLGEIPQPPRSSGSDLKNIFFREIERHFKNKTCEMENYLPQKVAHWTFVGHFL